LDSEFDTLERSLKVSGALHFLDTVRS